MKKVSNFSPEAADYTRAFRLADKNGDGRVTQKEARRAWRQFERNASNQELQSEDGAQTLGALMGLSHLVHQAGRNGKALDRAEISQNLDFLQREVKVEFIQNDPDLTIGSGRNAYHGNTLNIDLGNNPETGGYSWAFDSREEFSRNNRPSRGNGSGGGSGGSVKPVAGGGEDIIEG